MFKHTKQWDILFMVCICRKGIKHGLITLQFMSIGCLQEGIFFFTWGGRDRRLCEEIFSGCLRFITVNIQSKAPGKDALVLRSIYGPKGPPILATAPHQPGWAPGVPSTHCSLPLEGTGHLELRHPASSVREQPSGICKPQSSVFWDGSPHRG